MKGLTFLTIYLDFKSCLSVRSFAYRIPACYTAKNAKYGQNSSIFFMFREFFSMHV